MKILWIYPNSFLTSSIPLGIANLSAICKNAGHEVGLFDTTFYDTGENQNEKKEKLGQAPDTDYSFFDDCIKTDMFGDLYKKLNSFVPDIIAISIVEESWHIAKQIIKNTKKYYYTPIVVGGVFPTCAYKKIKEEFPYIKICVGEGEKWILEGVENVHDKTMADINITPFPDYDLFHPKMMHRPMSGKMRKTLMVETQRGCPYNCHFCNSEAQKKLYGNKFYRRKTIERLGQELCYMIEKHDPEFVYFVGDSFLSMPEHEWSRFCYMYICIRFGLPFWMNTRPETITKDKVKDLEDIGCVRCNIGIEHGDPTFRKDMVNRNLSNETIINAAKCFKDSKIDLVVNNIIGFPGETREQLQATIDLNKKIVSYITSASAFIFTPYHGTWLRDYAIKNNYLDESVICSNIWAGSVLKNQEIDNNELIFIQNNFNDIIRGIGQYNVFGNM